MKKLRYIMLLAGLMSLSLQTIYAQRITRSFRNTSMSEALTILAKSTKDIVSTLCMMNWKISRLPQVS